MHMLHLRICRSLLHLADGRPLLLTEPVGQPPLVTVPDFIDRQSVHIQRHTSVLTGAFSCCRMGHQVKTLDGGVATIPCDKVILREVLASVFEEGLAKAEARFLADPQHGNIDFGSGLFWGSLGHSYASEPTTSFFKWYFLKILRQAIFAETTGEPDFEALGWCKPLDQLTDKDVANYMGRFGMPWGRDDVEKSVKTMKTSGTGAILAAQEGNLPMLRYAVEKLNSSITAQNVVGVTALMHASRNGFSRVVGYIIDKIYELSKDEEEARAHLDIKTTAGLGLCAIDGAATRGHVEVVRLLAARGADVHARRANGRTSLHSACAFGQLACVRELLALGVDPEGVDNDGKKPVDLVTKSCSFSAWPTTEHDEILEVLRAEICRKREGGDQR